MMRTTNDVRFLGYIGIFLAACAGAVLAVHGRAASEAAEAEAASPNEEVSMKPKPVVDSMHQFMEYVFEPSYKLLKTNMAAAPKDKQGWKPVKAGALTLAEGGNLLLMRAPDEDAKKWNELSVAVRERAGELYQAARGQNYPAAGKHYRVMLESCNACHQHFADGEHQLKP